MLCSFLCLAKIPLLFIYTATGWCTVSLVNAPVWKTLYAVFSWWVVYWQVPLLLALTECFVRSLEADKIPLCSHYSTICNEWFHSIPQWVPSVNNSRVCLSLVVWSHSVRCPCMLSSVKFKEVWKLCSSCFCLSSSDPFLKGRRGRGPVWKPCHRLKSNLAVIFPATLRP